jgi:hypothetical protein
MYTRTMVMGLVNSILNAQCHLFAGLQLGQGGGLGTGLGFGQQTQGILLKSVK